MKTAKKMHEAEALGILHDSDYTQRVYFSVLEICCDEMESVEDLLDSLSYDEKLEIRG